MSHLVFLDAGLGAVSIDPTKPVGLKLLIVFFLVCFEHISNLLHEGLFLVAGLFQHLGHFIGVFSFQLAAALRLNVLLGFSVDHFADNN